MTKDIKVKYDFGLRLLEYEGPANLLDSVLERISKSSLAKVGTSDAAMPLASHPKKSAVGKAVKPAVNPAGKPKKTSSSKVTTEKFDIYGNGDDVPKLEKFFEEKKPGSSNAEKIVVIAYYITELMGQDSFSDGQIEFAFKMLKIKRPTHLRQIITNAKNSSDWFDKFEDTLNWELTRGGELFVSDELPRDNENG